MHSHRSRSKPSSGYPNTRAPAARTPASPPDPQSNYPPNYNFHDSDDLPGPTPPWFKRRHNPPTKASPSPQEPFEMLPEPAYFIPQLEIISIPKHAKYLHVVPPEEDPVLRDHVPRPRPPKGTKPGKIVVMPAERPIALLTAHTPPPAPFIALPAHSAPGTPGTPERNPYIDPGLATGLPRALGMRAFPIRAQGPWRHGG
ncbi:hypothetical protein C8R43DRAFT_1000636 [Mycena crocata]|nr:hypothetical protein C8R43DRAFT_1000636 [Mycena crocata]